MNNNKNNTLYQKVSAKNYFPSHVAEVGVWHPDTSNVYQFIQDNIKTTLIEPDPESIKLIKSEFLPNNKITLHEVAVCDFNGEIELYKRDSSTFVSLLPNSPAIANDNVDLENTDKFTSQAVMFNELDDSTIDLISIDTEGSEWFVIKNMKSRPTVISIETHGGVYTNPYLDELSNWMEHNNYTLWYKDKSDSVYVISDTIPVTFIDKLNLILMNIKLSFKFMKKKISLFRKSYFNIKNNHTAT